ncbi:MAG: sigma-70 family RNA polymerase sigma factor [Zavarzinella sp.]
MKLLVRLQNRDDDAARIVVERFRDRLIQIAANQFDTWLRERADPEGIVQSAFFSFFVRARDSKLIPHGWDEMAAILVVITIRKCSNRRKFLRADKRDLSREQSIRNPDETSDWQPEYPILFHPEDELIFQELLDWLLRGFETREREIVELSLHGKTATEIAEQLNRPVRSVRRVLTKVRERVDQLKQAEGLG